MRLLAGVAVVALSALAPSAARDLEERDLRAAMGYAQRGLAALQKGNVARARDAELRLKGGRWLGRAQASIGASVGEQRRRSARLQ